MPYSGVKNGVDVYKENWLIKGELTNVGKRQLYLLGVKTRKKYMEENDFLSKEYNPKEILIKSTDHNRTIESVYSYIQGLYPAGTGPTINETLYSKEKVIFPPNEKYYKQFKDYTNEYNMRENKYALPYQMTILPIHIFYKPDHDFQLYDPDICTTLLDHFIELNEREEIKTVADDILNETNNLLVDIEPNADNASYFYDYWNLYKYTDNIICDQTDVRNYTKLKEEVSYVNDSLMEKLYNKSDKFIKSDSLTTNLWVNLSIVGTSYTMHSIVNWMEKAINAYKNGKNETYIKFVIYSAHDSSIGNIEGFMNYSFGTPIEFAGFSDCRFFELIVDDDGKYKVKYIKGDNTIKLNINFDEFKKVINDKTWSDEEVADFCKFDNSNSGNSNTGNNNSTNNTDSYVKRRKSSKKKGLLALVIILSAVNAALLAFLIYRLILIKRNQ